MKHPSKKSPNQTNQVQTGLIWIAKTVRMKHTTPTTQQHLSVIVKAQGTCSTKCQHQEVFFGKQGNLTIVDEREAWDIVGNDDNSFRLMDSAQINQGHPKRMT